MTEKEKMISGEYYNAFDPELVKGRRKAKNLLHSLNVKEYRVTKKAKEILGWEAKHNLEDMCKSSCNWQSKNPKGYGK